MRVPVTDLVGRPGETRAYAASLAREDIGTDPWGPAEDVLTGPIDVDLHLDSVVEGILVHGRVAFTLTLTCARCLETVVRDEVVEVAELFQDPRKLEPGAELEPGYELIDSLTAIDLERMLHDVVVLDLPVRVLCDRPGCEPPGGTSGQVLSEDDRRAVQGPDPRWAKLADLDLRDD